MEIERKFLVKESPSLDSKQVYAETIEQYYLDVNPEIRIRKITDSKRHSMHYMTIKSEGDLVREELEFQIYPTVFNELRLKAKDMYIKKIRYYINIGNSIIASLDFYLNNSNSNIGLMTVEVEFDNLEEAKLFNPPEWFGKEVTYDWRYKNKNLAKYKGVI